jgi:hypothetical protein
MDRGEGELQKWRMELNVSLFFRLIV